MTILYLSDIRFPLERANGIQTMETCHALSERSHNVSLLVRADTMLPARDPFDFYGLSRSNRLVVDRVPVFGPPQARRVGYLALAMGRLLKRHRWDVVFTRDLGVAAVVLGCPFRPPLVYESHGYAPVFSETLSELVPGAVSGSARKLRRLNRREERVWRQADGYVTTTRVLADDMTERFGSRSRLVTLSNGVRLSDQRRLEPVRRSGLPIAAYAGHFYPWKGADVLVEALARVPEMRGLFIGGHSDESDEARLRALAHHHGVGDRITFTGMVPKHEVPRLLLDASILVVPTIKTPSARYTSPLKLFEYMALGRPVVVSDLPPIREVVEDGRNAVLVPPGDVEGLVTGLRRVLADSAAADRMAQTAFNEASMYSWARRAERLEHLLHDVVTAQ